MKIKVCKECGSENVWYNAQAVWSSSKNDWVLGEVYDMRESPWCSDCDCEVEIVEQDIKVAQQVEKEVVEPPTHGDSIQSLNFIWDKLNTYMKRPLKGYVKHEVSDDERDDICTSMCWIEEEMGIRYVNGEYISIPKTEEVEE